MIKISVEPGAAFDILSILEIKRLECDGAERKQKLKSQIENLQSEINDAIGYDLARKIYRSEFYTNLYNANCAVFEQINKQKSEADLLNYQRFLSKKALQEEFFKKEIEEIKLGY